MNLKITHLTFLQTNQKCFIIYVIVKIYSMPEIGVYGIRFLVNSLYKMLYVSDEKLADFYLYLAMDILKI